MKQVLDTCYALGNQMLEALQEGDIEQFHQLIQQRETLIAQLTTWDTSPHAEEIQQLKKEYAPLFQQQQLHLQKALKTVEQQVTQALQTTQTFRRAHQSYAHQNPPPRLLHPRLQG